MTPVIAARAKHSCHGCHCDGDTLCVTLVPGPEDQDGFGDGEETGFLVATLLLASTALLDTGLVTTRHKHTHTTTPLHWALTAVTERHHQKHQHRICTLKWTCRYNNGLYLVWSVSSSASHDENDAL